MEQLKIITKFIFAALLISGTVAPSYSEATVDLTKIACQTKVSSVGHQVEIFSQITGDIMRQGQVANVVKNRGPQKTYGRRTCSSTPVKAAGARTTASNVSATPTAHEKAALKGCKLSSTGTISFYGPGLKRLPGTFDGTAFNPCDIHIAHPSDGMVGKTAVIRDLATGIMVRAPIKDTCPACRKRGGHKVDLTEGMMLKFRANPYENLQSAQVWICS